MKKFILIVALFFAFSAVSLAQQPTGQLKVFYETIQGFDFRSGTPAFDIQDESFHGGGFGFNYTLNRWFDLWTQTTFFSGVRQGSIDLKLINQMQGLRAVARSRGPINVYGKGGMGFTRHVFNVANFGEQVRFGTTFVVGGGVELKWTDATLIFIEVNQNAMSLPDITGLDARDKWDSNTGIALGLAFQF